MQKLLRPLLIMMLSSAVILTSSPSTAWASPPANSRIPAGELEDTIELLQGCDRALTRCQAANADKDHVISVQTEMLRSTEARVRELEREQGGILKSSLLWFVAGALFTGATVYLVK